MIGMSPDQEREALDMAARFHGAWDGRETWPASPPLVPRDAPLRRGGANYPPAIRRMLHAEVTRLIGEGVDPGEIAARLGVRRKWVTTVRHRLGLPRPRSPRREDLARRIALLPGWREMPVAGLARMLGAARRTIDMTLREMAQ